MSRICLRIAVRAFTDFQNAFAEQIALYCSKHSDVEIEAVPFDLRQLHAELFEENGLRTGAWDIGFLSTDWTAEAVGGGTVGVRLSTWRNAEIQREIPAYKKIEEISLGARRLPRSVALPAFAAILNDVAMQSFSSKERSAEILRRAQQPISRQRIVLQ